MNQLTNQLPIYFSERQDLTIDKFCNQLGIDELINHIVNCTN